MKIIDLLNKIANGEIDRNVKYHFTQYDYCTVIDFFNRYIVDKENLNLEILEEEKKIPERVLNAKVFDVPKLNNMELSNIALTNKEDIKIIKDTLNKVLDYLKSKGE